MPQKEFAKKMKKMTQIIHWIVLAVPRILFLQDIHMGASCSKGKKRGSLKEQEDDEAPHYLEVTVNPMILADDKFVQKRLAETQEKWKSDQQFPDVTVPN
jgi:hypothetical protein